MFRVREWGGGEGEHIHLMGHFLDLFLVGHAEALLLVHHQKAQILEVHILLEHPVGADDDVDLPGMEHPQSLLLHFGGAEAAEGVNFDGIAGKTG